MIIDKIFYDFFYSNSYKKLDAPKMMIDCKIKILQIS